MSGPKKIIAGVTSGPPPVYAGGAGYGKNIPYMQTVEFYTDISTSGNGNHTESIATSGYNGRLDIYIAGTGSQPHDLYNGENESDAFASGTGEIAKLTYNCLGDETGFTITQANWMNTARTTSDSGTYAYAEFKVNGGVNANKTFKVGSGAGRNASFGIAGVASKVSDDSGDAVFTYVGSGGYRNSSTLFYSDGTNYPPGDYESFSAGDTTKRTTYPNGAYVELSFSDYEIYAVEWKATATASVDYRTRVRKFSTNSYPAADSFGMCVIVYANNQ